MTSDDRLSRWGLHEGQQADGAFLELGAGQVDTTPAGIEASLTRIRASLLEGLPKVIREALAEEKDAIVLKIDDLGFQRIFPLAELEIQLKQGGSLELSAKMIGDHLWAAYGTSPDQAHRALDHFLHGDDEFSGNPLEIQFSLEMLRVLSEVIATNFINTICEKRSPCESCGRGGWPSKVWDGSRGGEKPRFQRFCPPCEVIYLKTGATRRQAARRKKASRKQGRKKV